MPDFAWRAGGWSHAMLEVRDLRKSFAGFVAVGGVSLTVAAAPLPIPESELRAVNPRVVLVLTVNDDRPELCAYARSGLLSITGHPGRTPVVTRSVPDERAPEAG